MIPWCTSTKPEVAHIGATRAELEPVGRCHDRYRMEFGDLDRGATDDAADGFAEVLTEKGGDQILGATIVGKDAGEQLAPLVMLMSVRIGLGRLHSVVLPYPTQSEYLRPLADAYLLVRVAPFHSGAAPLFREDGKRTPCCAHRTPHPGIGEMPSFSV